MAGSILDALIAQARGAISRAYLIAGFVPALAVALGWQLHEAKGVAGLQRDIESLLLLKTAQLPAATLARVVGIAALGALFYGGRGLILRLLQEGPPVAFVRKNLIERQVRRWWERRQQQSRSERDLAFLDYLVNSDFTYVNWPAGFRATPAEATASSRCARAYVNKLATFASRGEWSDGPLNAELVVAGLRGFYSMALADRVHEQIAWRQLYASAEGAMVIDRISAEVFRRMVEATASAQEQPEQEKQLAPTLLGNRVAALDDYAASRYNIATSTLWTRLWGVLGQAERQEIANAQLRVEVLANMTVAFAATGAIATAASVYRAVRVAGAAIVIDWWTVAFTAVCLALTAGSYRTAVYAFGGVADGIIRLIDLHRVRVLMTFGLAQPATFADERAMFKELAEFFGNAMFEDLGKRTLDRGKSNKM